MSRRKIPTLIGLVLTLVLVVTVAATTSVVQKVTTLFSQAGSSIIPNSIGTANLTDKGFTVYWTTPTSTLGSVSYGKTASLADGIALDDRNLTAPNEKYAAHFVRISGLSANTKYYFNISGREEGPMNVTTLDRAPDKPVTDPAFGKINDASGNSLSGTVAVLEVTGAGKTVTISKDDGSYVLPAIPQATSGQAETISFLYGPDTATITCKVGQDRPLPGIKMGDNVDCLKTTTSGTTTGTIATAGAGFKPSVGSRTTVSGALTINLSEREAVSTSLPTISGKAGPNQLVTIVIHSDVAITGSVQADSTGNWSWTPPSNLSPGQHTVTVTVTNNDGTKQTVTRTFTVPSGTSILPVTSGTPSAEVFHLACVNQACTKISGAGSDSCTTNADCVPAVTTTTAKVSAPPATGAVENTLAVLGLGLFLIGLGLVPEIWQRLGG